MCCRTAPVHGLKILCAVHRMYAHSCCRILTSGLGVVVEGCAKHRRQQPAADAVQTQRSQRRTQTSFVARCVLSSLLSRPAARLLPVIICVLPRQCAAFAHQRRQRAMLRRTERAAAAAALAQRLHGRLSAMCNVTGGRQPTIVISIRRHNAFIREPTANQQ